MSVDTDNRKRSLDSEPIDSSKRSKKALDELSTEGPLTQADVVYFKKEAIWRQMISYKQQVLKLKGEVKRLSRDCESSKHIVTVLTAWYDEILSLFDELGDDDGILVAFDDSENSNIKVDEKLQNIRTKLSRAISSKNIGSLDSAKLQELSLLKSQNQILAKDNVALSDKIINLESELQELLHDQERDRSVTLKRVDDSRKEVNSLEQQEKGKVKVESQTPQPSANEINGHANVNSNGNGNGNGNGSGVNNGKDSNLVDSEELDKLRLEIEELKSSNDLLGEQVSELTNTNQTLLQNVNSLESKLHNLDEKDIQENLIYKKIVKNNQSLQDQISKVNKLNALNVSKLSELEEKQNEVKKLVESELIKENEALKQQMSKNEQDLIRVRTTRDELLAKNTILTKQVEEQKTTQALLELNETYSKRIEELTKDKFNLDASESEKIDLLTNEIKEIESAFKQTRELTIKKLSSQVDHESQVKKLVIEKNKADQKYFASMRLKDSLTNENKVLKQQVGKSQEMIKSLSELETNYLGKIDVLTKSLTDYKIIKENALQENFSLQDTVKNLKITNETLEADVARKDDKIKAITSEVVELKDQNNKQDLQIIKLSKSLANTESLLVKYKTNNTNSIIQADEEQLEALRSIAKCSLCTKNWKDTAITVCGHVFCSSCTQERLAARLRRCPSCNKGFSSNDLLTIHL
ncbi:E3 ubiquitin-protein ligase bre1 [Lodderomyces elongisporus]|uniref:E3 ubiquitin-protein ligase bre1 n=1 Tax=Lodderomyces elongisporus TaxID=36914 RepID=UPI002926D809|nr:E3 ubiquitin-protein ligase bre1 [Lodderomyces elongisporus]WLF80733.1 E3 ubiquitin-protein ligase bre1 [Lodderomyces elongisporus]